MSKKRKIELVMLIIFLGTTISIIYHYFMGLKGYGYPYNTFLFRPDDRLMDFVWPYRISGNPYGIARADFQNFPFLYRF